MRYPAMKEQRWRRPILACVFLITAAALGCRDWSTAPDEPVVATSQAGTNDRPFSGRCEVQVTSTPLSSRIALTGRGVCQLTHLGNSQYVIAVTADPVQGTLTGSATFTAANGDELRATVAGPFAAGANPTTWQATATFSGGTGRFAEATGSAELSRGAGRGTTVDIYSGIVRFDPSSQPPSSAPGILLEISPSAVLLPGAGAQRQLTAYSVDALGNRTPVLATFTSSDPDLISVSASGLLTANAGLGSSQITAHANGLTSPPALVLVARPVAGALLLSDDHVVGPPVPVDPNADYALGWRERFHVRGVVPAVGQIVVGTGGLAIGGRVTAVGPPAGGVVEVEYELVALSELFEAIAVNQTLSLTHAVITSTAASDGVPAGALGSRRGWVQPRVRPAPRLTAPLNPLAALTEVEFDLGPFSCEAKLDAGITVPITLDLFSFTVDPNLQLDLVIANEAIQRFVAHGTINTRLSANPVLRGTVKGSFECKYHLRTIILPIGGPVARFIGGQIPLGVGFAVEAKAELDNLGVDAFLDASAATSMGFDCTTVCQAVAQLTTKSGGFFKPIVPTLDGLKTELAASFFGYAELQVGSPLAQEAQFQIIELKAGLEQKAELATERVQALDPAYASKVTLAPVVEAGTTAKVSSLAGLLNLVIPDLKFAPSLPALAQSPAGTFTISPTSVAAGNEQALGEEATFTITLDPVTYLGIYAVDQVEIHWLRPDGNGGLLLEPGRPGCTSIAATAGQTTFTCDTDFLEEHEGEQTFVAFVKPMLFGVSQPFRLEVGTAKVTVVAAQTPLAIETVSLPEGEVGSSYSTSLQASGGTGSYVWSVVAGQLPAGLSLATSGSISGTPSAAGTSNFTARVVSGTESADRIFSITVKQPVSAINGTYSGTVQIVRNGNLLPTPTVDNTAFISLDGSTPPRLHGNVCLGFGCAAQYFFDGELQGSTLVNGTLSFFDFCSAQTVTFPAEGSAVVVNDVATVNVVASATNCGFTETITIDLTRTGPLPP